MQQVHWRNPRAPEWGIGVVQAADIAGKIEVYFPALRAVKRVRLGKLGIGFTAIPPGPQMPANLHAAFRSGMGLQPATTRPAASRPHRVTHCWMCKGGLDNAVNIECGICGWIVCPRDGACGCGHTSEPRY